MLLALPSFWARTEGVLAFEGLVLRGVVLHRAEQLGTQEPVLPPGVGIVPRDQPEDVDQDVPLAPAELPDAVVAAQPPTAVVLTDWLSTIPALGWGGG